MRVPYLLQPNYLHPILDGIFQACNLDPMLDDSIQFAKRLRGLGVEVHVDVVDNLPHGYLNFVLVSKEAKQASDLCVQRLRESLWLNKVEDEEWDILEYNEGSVDQEQ